MKTSILLPALLLSSRAFAFDALPAKPPVPADNPVTPAKVELGKQLYFDPRLSKDGSISCNSCHNVMAGGDDNRPNSVGVKGQHGGRSAPTVWNSAFMSVQFWDGRAKSLEEQAKGPLTNPIEMGMDSHALVIERIKKIPGYVEAFKKAFPRDSDITIDHVAKAIATYERTLLTPNSAFDRYLKGEKKALPAAAVRGMGLVQSVGCTSCHSGPNFAGPQLPEGTPFFQKFPTFPGSKYDAQYSLTKDGGRFEVTKNEADRGMWRVPTWRNVAVTAPYFHNGSVKTLGEAIRVMAKTQLNKELKDDEVKDIESFLESLTGKFPEQKMPRLPATNGEYLVAD
ncbi:MAG: cytochrome-c peroxidase [Proteobacteria bacterium]|nr:cytochrome-c peroxidase [Pseudomonadota bacterium]